MSLRVSLLYLDSINGLRRCEIELVSITIQGGWLVLAFSSISLFRMTDVSEKWSKRSLCHKFSESAMHLFKNMALLKRAVKACFIFAVTAMVYYGLAYNAAALPGSGKVHCNNWHLNIQEKYISCCKNLSYYINM